MKNDFKITRKQVYDKFIDKGFRPSEIFCIFPPIPIVDPPLIYIQLYDREEAVKRELDTWHSIHSSWLDYLNTWIDYQNYKFD